MKINNINGNMNFGKVFAVSGAPVEQFTLRKELYYAEGSALIYDATDFYKNDRKRGTCQISARNGDDVFIIITGKEDIDKVKKGNEGWSTIKDIEHKISQIFTLKNVDESTDKFDAKIANIKIAREIKREMLK